MPSPCIRQRTPWIERKKKKIQAGLQTVCVYYAGWAFRHMRTSVAKRVFLGVCVSLCVWKVNPKENEAQACHVNCSISHWHAVGALSLRCPSPPALVFLWLLAVAAAEAYTNAISTKRCLLLGLSNSFQLFHFLRRRWSGGDIHHSLSF